VSFSHEALAALGQRAAAVHIHEAADPSAPPRETAAAIRAAAQFPAWLVARRLTLATLGEGDQPAQQDSFATSAVKVWAASFSASAIVSYGAQVWASW
jgi:hypothetical protein